MEVSNETYHPWDQADQMGLFRVHFSSQFDDTKHSSIDVLAYKLERLDQRTVVADGVKIQFHGDIADISSIE